MTKHILWDFDGTLGYRDGGMWAATLHEIVTRAAPGLGVTIEQLRPHVQAGFPWHTPETPHTHIRSGDEWWAALAPVFQRAFEAVGVPPGQSLELAAQVRPVYADLTRWRLFDDAIPTLEQLSAKGWTHVVLSNHAPELRAIVRRVGLAPLLADVFNSAETGFEKPHPEAFRRALAAIGETWRVWMIGDSPIADVRGAEAAGIPAILVRKQDAGARFCCRGLAEAAEVVA